MFSKSLFAGAILALGLPALAHAQTYDLTFGNLHNGANILNYFNGGQGSLPQDGTGPSDGIVFSANANEQKKGISGAGTGKFENNPSGVNGVLYFPFSNTTTSYINVGTGFTIISVDYSLLLNESSQDGTMDLWSGLGGTGTLLDTVPLTAAATTVPCSTTLDNGRDEFCTWSAASDENFGVAESVSFPGTNIAGGPQIEFDNLQIVGVPEPGSLPLLAAGLGGLLVFARRRRA